MKALLIDYYDSFSFNVVDAFERCGVNQIEHIYSDQIDLTKAPECDFIILSPGPNHPNDEQKSQELVLANHTRIPIFGICFQGRMGKKSLKPMKFFCGLRKRHGLKSLVLVWHWL